MKKYFFPLAIVACTALLNTSCSSSSTEPPVPQENEGDLPKPTYSEQAVSFEIASDNVKDKSGKASLKAINFTESGKAIFEVKTTAGTKFVTYGATIDGDIYIVTDANGREIGRLRKLTSRAADDVTIEGTITVTINGVEYTFTISTKATSTSVPPTAVSRNTNNLARTWQVASMNVVLSGDIDLSKLVVGGNLKEFADAAQEAGANLNAEEMKALSKVVNSMTFNKNGLLSIEYSDASSDGCNWLWASGEKQEYIRLLQRNGAEFGNKFLSDRSVVKVDFTPTSVALTMKTDIRGSKNYSATLTVVLK